MAKAFECDKCHKLEKGDPVALVTLAPPPDSFYMKNCNIPEWKNAQLCVTCVHDLTGVKKT